MIRLALTLAIISITISASLCLAEHNPDHQHGTAQAQSRQADVLKHAACKQCGMNREMFSSSRMLITYGDGSTVGTCSIACLVTELKANKGKKIKSVQVADYNSRNLIDADKAIWVIGGDLPGVMAPVATWAFEKKSAAVVFIKAHDGKPATYKEVLAQAEKQ